MFLLSIVRYMARRMTPEVVDLILFTCMVHVGNIQLGRTKMGPVAVRPNANKCTVTRTVRSQSCASRARSNVSNSSSRADETPTLGGDMSNDVFANPSVEAVQG